MARFFRKREALLGKRPGEMVYIGKDPAKQTKIEALIYNEEDCIEKKDIGLEELKNLPGGGNIWINIEGVADVPVIETVKDIFRINPLITADIMNTGTRPKYLHFKSGLFFSLKMLNNDDDGRIISEQISILVYDRILITFQEAPGDVFDPVRERLKNSIGRIRSSGVDYLTYCLIDAVSDNYIRILQTIAEKVEDIEEALLSDPDKGVLERIIFLKKELIFLGKTVKPAKDAVKILIGEKPALIEQFTDFYNDLHSNLTHIVETIDIYKEITSQQQNNYDTYINNRLNEIMKFLTIFSVIFLPLTLITGIYGTNFDFIPELHFRYGYLFLWGLLAAFALIMVLVFKRKKWF